MKLLTHALNHLPLDKMEAILADDNFKCIFFNENDKILIQILQYRKSWCKIKLLTIQQG